MKKALKTTLIVFIWLVIWLVASLLINLPLLFPSPIDVLVRLFQLLGTSEFYLSTMFSFGRIILGITIGLLSGLAIALLCSISKHIYDFFMPLIAIVKSTPIVAFVFLVNLFVGSGYTIVFICVLMVFPIVFANIYQGIIGTDKNLLELCKVYKIPYKKRLKALYLPGVAPYFFSSLLSSIGLAWKAGIAAEILCTPRISIGIEIFNAKTYIEYIDLFAWILTVVILSLIFELVVTKLLKLLSNKFLTKAEV
ncbi:MAG: ABC transporter permease subunit [Clostridia bacterium]|nr:ABC transporter permease subunit [Clostridia bacterium]